MTGKTFALCALVAFGAGVSIQAQQALRPPASGTSNVQALGNAQTTGNSRATGDSQATGNNQPVDETTLSLNPPATAANQAAKPAGPDTLAYFLRMVVVLAVVLGVMYLIFTFMRRLARPKDAGDSPIRLLASRSLGAGKGVHLVGLGSKAWLLGSSEQGLRLIAEVDDKELLDGLELEEASRKPMSRDFSAMLQALLRPKRAPVAPPPEGGGLDSRWLSRQRERLGKFKDGDR